MFRDDWIDFDVFDDDTTQIQTEQQPQTLIQLGNTNQNGTVKEVPHDDHDYNANLWANFDCDFGNNENENENESTIKDEYRAKYMYKEINNDVNIEPNIKDNNNDNNDELEPKLRTIQLSTTSQYRPSLSTGIYGSYSYPNIFFGSNMKKSPLHKLKCDDILNIIAHWKYNDNQYKMHLKKIMEILVAYDLNGYKICILRIKDIKAMIINDLKTFLTFNTINIMFEALVTQIDKNKGVIQSKSSAEIAYIMHHYPLQKLLDRINSENINGQKFIEYYNDNKDFIGDETGWSKEEVYQIQAKLFMKRTYTKSEFKENMRNIVKKNEILKDSVKKIITDTILKYDVELIHFNIKYA
eukprot:468457_1